MLPEEAYSFAQETLTTPSGLFLSCSSFGAQFIIRTSPFFLSNKIYAKYEYINIQYVVFIVLINNYMLLSVTILI